MKRVAIVFDNNHRPETTGLYCRRALGELVLAGHLIEVEHFVPGELAEIPAGRFDLVLHIDDGLQTNLQSDGHSSAFWAIDTHVDFQRCLALSEQADLVFAAQRDGAERLRAAGLSNVTWMPLACDPRVHAREAVAVEYDVSFVGHIFPGERQRLMDLVAQRFPRMFVGYRYYEEMARIYSASKTVFNRSVNGDVNMRVFEALCSGSLLVTDALEANGLDELFQDGTHLATYGSDEELLDKLKYFIKHDESRQRIADRGRRAVLAAHTYGHRIKAILSHVQAATPPVTIPAIQIAAPPVSSPAALAATDQGAGNSSLASRDPGYFEFDRPEVAELVPLSARRVLDVGCGSGRLGSALRARQACEVIGIELDPVAAENAAHCLDQVIVGDVADGEVDFPNGHFDCVICADVLEHLRSPESVLRKLRRWISPDGCLVVSVPNVRNHVLVKSLLAGNWTYESAGLMDADHVRCFTRRELEKLFFRAGFTPDQLQMVPGEGFDEWVEDGRPRQVSLGGLQVRAASATEAQEFFAYQWLMRGRPVADSQPGLTTIVIITHNQLPYTRLCIDSIRLRTDEPYELIFVDNGSTDGTPKYLDALTGVTVIKNQENRGFPAAANQGLRAARGEQVLLLNNDTIVTTGWLRRMLDTLRANDETGLVGPVSNNVSGPQQIPIGYQHLSELDGWAWDWSQAHHAEAHRTDRLVGFCLLLKRAVIDRIGLLDERFGTGCFEDDDYCRRARQAGFQLAIAQDAFVHHFGSATFQGANLDLGEILACNQRIYEDKWRGTDLPRPTSEPADPDGSLHPDGRQRSARSRFALGVPRADGLVLTPNTVRLSACLIVRDNERTISACLESIRPWVDEVVVVDTGSCDRTPQLCRELGARVFEFPWCDDFSAARNQSLRHARGEWLFWMDSDDTIPPECGRRLRQLVDGAHAERTLGYVLQVHCPGMGPDELTIVDHVKLFRNRPDLCFEFRIHEQVLPSIRRADGDVLFTDIYVIHSGSDRSPAGRQRKLERDFRLLELEVAERPDHPFVLFNLGMTHADASQHPQAIEYLRRCLAVSGPCESHVRKAYALLVGSLGQCGRLDEAVHECERGLERCPDDTELMFRRAVLYQEAGEPSEAAAIYQRILDGSPERHFSSRDAGLSDIKARHNLALVDEALGRFEAAEAEWRQLIADRPRYRPAWRGLGNLWLRQQRHTDVRSLIDELHAFSDSTCCEGVLLAAKSQEEQGNRQEARTILEQGVLDWPNDTDLQHELCRLLFEQSDLPAALTALQKLADMTPGDPAVLQNLGAAYLRLGDTASAIVALRESLRIRPHSSDARNLLQSALRAERPPRPITPVRVDHRLVGRPRELQRRAPDDRKSKR